VTRLGARLPAGLETFISVTTFRVAVENTQFLTHWLKREGFAKVIAAGVLTLIMHLQ
jgi:hypothetical protein